MLRRLVGPLGSGATSALARGSLRRVSTTTPSLKRFPPKQGLYDAALEKDSCGVGMVASLKAEPSHKIVADANTMLVRMSHRGGCGSEPNSGDGAGILTGVPDAFLRRIQPGLPAAGEYGVGNLFFPNNPEAVAKCKAIFEKHIDELGLQLVAWRTLPVDNSALGPTSLESEPAIEQLLVAGRPGAMSGRELNRELWRLRILASAEVRADAAMEDFYVCSLHTGTIVYKGQLTPEQVWGYFLDLQQPDYMSHLALVHSRFSTNTFPSWSRAQPFRALCHNGEINTLRGNKNQMRSREASLVSAALGDKLTDLLPITSNDMSDSGNFDAVAELLIHAGDRQIHEAVMMMVPEAWQNKDMPPDRRAFYEYHSCLMEPWDGPAMMSFTDGQILGGCLDRNGLRPSRYYVTHDGRVMLSSEVGVLDDLADADVATKGRLEPGRMFLIDFEQGRIIPDDELKTMMAAARPYAEWMAEQPLRLGDWVAQAGVGAPAHPPREQLNSHLAMHGFTKESAGVLVSAMAAGKEALGSMGVDTPLAVLSQQPRSPSHYFKQLFAQVTNPPIDPIREEVVMSLECPVGPEGNLLESTPEQARRGGSNLQPHATRLQPCETSLQPHVTRPQPRVTRMQPHVTWPQPYMYQAARLLVPSPILTLGEMEALKAAEYRGWKAVTLDASIDAAEARSNPNALREALHTLCAQAEAAVLEQKAPLLVLSDRAAGRDRLPVPSLLACAAVHQHLLHAKARTRTGLLVEAGDAKEPHDFCTLVGYGADGVCPHGAYAAVAAFEASPGGPSEADLLYQYRKSAGKAMLKVLHLHPLPCCTPTMHKAPQPRYHPIHPPPPTPPCTSSPLHPTPNSPHPHSPDPR